MNSNYIEIICTVVCWWHWQLPDFYQILKPNQSVLHPGWPWVIEGCSRRLSLPSSAQGWPQCSSMSHQVEFVQNHLKHFFHSFILLWFRKQKTNKNPLLRHAFFSVTQLPSKTMGTCEHKSTAGCPEETVAATLAMGPRPTGSPSQQYARDVQGAAEQWVAWLEHLQPVLPCRMPS